jgi:hypothetical protein
MFDNSITANDVIVEFQFCKGRPPEIAKIDGTLFGWPNFMGAQLKP